LYVHQRRLNDVHNGGLREEIHLDVVLLTINEERGLKKLLFDVFFDPELDDTPDQIVWNRIVEWKLY
jgi:hypothetical protein